MESLESLVASFSSFSPTPLISNTRNAALVEISTQNNPTKFENSGITDHSSLYKQLGSRGKNSQNARRVAALREQKAYART